MGSVVGERFALAVDAFLYHMVRNIAGVLIAIGSGKEKPAWALTVLQARDRSVAGVTAPAEGLYLTRVNYPDRFALPVPSFDNVLLPF